MRPVGQRSCADARTPSGLARRPQRVRCFVGDAPGRPRGNSAPEQGRQETRPTRDSAALVRMAACSAAASSSRSRSTGCTCRIRHGDHRHWAHQDRARHADDRRAREQHGEQRPSCEGPLLTLPFPHRSDRSHSLAGTAWQPRPQPERGAGRQATQAARYEWFSQRGQVSTAREAARSLESSAHGWRTSTVEVPTVTRSSASVDRAIGSDVA